MPPTNPDAIGSWKTWGRTVVSDIKTIKDDIKELKNKTLNKEHLENINTQLERVEQNINSQLLKIEQNIASMGKDFAQCQTNCATDLAVLRTKMALVSVGAAIIVSGITSAIVTILT